MDQITIILATRNRQEKLARMLASVPCRLWLEVWVICDGDPFTYTWLQSGVFPCVTRVELLASQSGAVHARNFLSADVDDGLLYATDDIVFLPNAIDNALQAFNKCFSDDDGVVGFKQNQPHHLAGVALVGQRFLQRYPRKQLFYPGYFHFACQEIYWLSLSLKRWHYEEEALINHFHPSSNHTYMDQTHTDARIHRERDHQLITSRQSRGEVWGAA